ncbi:DUF692 family multinuclear iron-containing protein [Actinokineospora soli]|uniref:DUF692 family multinuclear iron-containing protein n=1 Tax=Actinokineospora soli TaxID=1048753 RepID=A0ABW2TQW7_9PSEU
MLFTPPRLGVGLGYRPPLHDRIVAAVDRIDFLEVISDQYLYVADERVERLVELMDRFPLVPHGVGMSIGTASPPDPDYLARLNRFVHAVAAPWFSDHLSFTKVPETDVEQLQPLWFTEESLDVVVGNVRTVKAAIPDVDLLLENITYYFQLPFNDMSEAEFTTRVLESTDTGLLLDVNNVWINSVNLGFDPHEFLDSIPLDRVVQIHIAGGVDAGGMIVDTHSAPVNEHVWRLLDHAVSRSPVKAVLLEWDQDWPDFDILLQHLDRARAVMEAHHGRVRR